MTRTHSKILVQSSPGMAPTFCNRCGDAAEEGCDPWDELTELDALLERLRLKRYDLKRKINRFHSPVVRQLPPDVTSTIFEFCLPDFTGPPLLAFTKENLSFPLSLGAICSYWRDIAWSTPSLWSSLVVRVTSKHDPHIIAGVAQEWLARSGQLPLSIRILARNVQTVPALADITNRYSTRWSDLDLCMPPDFYQHFCAIDNHAPTLKSIRFHSSPDMSSNFKLTCPRLERASLAYFPMDKSDIQLDNLTHLTLHSMSTIDSFLILRKTPRLVFCKVSGTNIEYRRQNIGAPVLTSLRCLHLLIGFAEDFLNNIIAPHLEVLSLPNYYNPSMEVVSSFLRRSACKLRSFSVIFSISPPYFEGFMSLLQSMPSLDSLLLRSITKTLETTTPEDYDPQNIFQLLAKVLSSQSSSQQEFLPNLRILEYKGELYLRPGNYNDLYSSLPTNNAVRGRLRLFKLDLFPASRIPTNMIFYLSSFAERGITVNVKSHSEDILRSSIDYYRSRGKNLLRDWTDNLDPSLFS